MRSTTREGQVWACGLNSLGELGDGTIRPSSVPVKVKGLGRSARVVSLVAAFANSGALLADGKYLDWGTNGQGQLGTGTLPRPSDVPVTVPLPARVRQVTQGGSVPGNGQTLALLTNGDLYAWGADGQGQLGDGKTAAQSSPELITPPSGVTYRALATSGGTSYGISTTGAVYAWGGGMEGQIGNGTTESSLTPVKVASGATGISATADDVLIAVTGRDCRFYEVSCGVVLGGLSRPLGSGCPSCRSSCHGVLGRVRYQATVAAMASASGVPATPNADSYLLVSSTKGSLNW